MLSTNKIESQAIDITQILLKQAPRHEEGAKIAYGKEHFAVLADGENPAQYIHATSVSDMMKNS
jgi:hypothetical protein